MNTYPHLSEEALVRQLQDLRNAHQSGSGKWPAWMQSNPAEVLKEKKFIVCGSQCRPEIRVLAKHANVIAVVDDLLTRRGGGKVLGIEVIDSDAWVELARNDNNVVSVMLVSGAAGYQHFNNVAMQWGLQALTSLQYLHLLTACGIDRNGEVGRFFWYGEEFFTRTLYNLDKLIESRKLLGDPWSRISWLCVLLYRMTLNPFYLTACAVGHHYDKFALDSYSMNRRFFQFSEDEVYVDGGAFTGDTIAQFVRAVDAKFRHIHSFESSSENNLAIRSMLTCLQDDHLFPLHPRVTLHEKGLWDSETTLQFNPSMVTEIEGNRAVANSATAHIVDAGLVEHIYEKEQESRISIQVPVTTIDSATNREATFIKLEIEGSELQALTGAKESIARNRPKMAISIYHKPEDLETLLDFVLETGQNYQLGFRQHNPLVPDAMVLYCW
jgi:FkbM family methyltransferase